MTETYELLQVATPTGTTRAVNGQRIAPGLAVTQVADGGPGWIVTHLPSGRPVINGIAPLEASEAHALAARLAAADVDWTAPAEALIDDITAEAQVQDAWRAFLASDRAAPWPVP